MAASPGPARRLRILVYSNVERDEAGGAQGVVRGLCHHLRGRGHHVSLGWNSARAPGTAPDGEWMEHYPVRAGQPRWLHLPTLMRLLVRLLRERPDVVHLHFASASARNFYAAAPWLGFRTVLTCHGSDLLRTLPQDTAHLRAILSGADALTAVSTDLAARIDEICGGPEGGKVMVIPNGVDTRFWHPAPAVEEPSRPNRIITVGRLEPVKGFDLLIDALARLPTALGGTRLTLVGEGSQREALEHRARAAGIAERVDFAGRLPREEIRARLHAADLFVMPSRSEGTPLALLEAMASGLACLATEVGGIPGAAQGAARLVAPDDPAALAQAMADLLPDAAARGALARAARARALAFSIDETHQAYESLLLALAQGRQSSSR